MPDHDIYGSLEERLADEARQMLGDSPQPAFAALNRELRRRRRRHSLAAAACAAAALIAVAAAAMSVRVRPAVKDMRNPTIAGEAPRPGAADTEEHLARDADDLFSHIGSVEEGSPAVMAIAILIPVPGGSGHAEFLPGWYVPEQIEAVDADDLSPAERSAVSRLLGLEPEVSDDETI